MLPDLADDPRAEAEEAGVCVEVEVEAVMEPTFEALVGSARANGVRALPCSAPGNAHPSTSPLLLS